MNDQQALETVLARLGLSPLVSVRRVGGTDLAAVTLMAKEGGVIGYSHFFCEFLFDLETGAFVEAGVWE